MGTARLYVVDDDADLRAALRDYLTRHGFDVFTAGNGAELDGLLAGGGPDLVVLDLMMPGEDGLAICRRLQARATPILMLSALGEAMDKVVGLEAGAADYLAKPFEPRELLARIRAILRSRRSSQDEEAAPSVQLRAGDWTLEPAERRLAHPDGRIVQLTLSETRLLKAFLERPGRIFPRDTLVDIVRGPSAEVFDRSMDLLVSRLRRKLGPTGIRPMIQTLRGEGYRFDLRAPLT